MTVSNEPGFYADGRYGIRIENIVLVREVKTANNFGDKGYLGFEHVTMFVCSSSSLDIDTVLSMFLLGHQCTRSSSILGSSRRTN
jgi:Xaa-Pro aminopeptidase